MKYRYIQLPTIHPLRYKAKNYGRGRTPATWQGWIILLCSCIVITGCIYIMLIDPTQQAWGISRTFLTVLFQIYICYATGEKPKWRWGKKKEKKNPVSE